ncbi:cell wall-binding repeat-containing protein [Paenibacillus sp. TRM 82003]|uniref:cell wall-binding repeat-containing protein n=1 Tax=Kineococcus sp. TRM81007 TaxID=2925831 RepID=UPI001F596388|nr:cell wall-binding repeat-containing protein [Kineococcus sp. TRM81007]MCI2239634.1 cell wall-binding repeat-containing protein [Kineococcus sp. TRM81007]MCI3926084.1 cell wall-binding repeat-containing protein [Paenibacillus sp. TRM 82003]
MTAATSRLRRRGIGAGVAALVGLTTVGFSSSAVAAEGFDPARVFGDNRFETAANIAQETFPEGVSTAVLVNAYSPADALSAAALAGSLDAAVLLTDQGSLNADTEDALDVLGVDNVVVVGGTAAVSAEQYTALDAAYAVERVEGADRVATALDVLTELAAAQEGPTQAFVVRAYGNPADALAAGPIAYANDIPILPVAGAVDDAWIEAVQAAGITTLTVLGGTAAVPASVETALRDAEFTVNERIDGATGQETAAELARLAVSEWGFLNTGVGVARGDTTDPTNAADALTSSQWLGTQQFPLLLTEGNGVLGAPAETYLTENSGTLATGVVFGGTAAVSNEVVQAVTEAGVGDVEAPATNQTLAVTPDTAVALSFGEVRQYSVAGLDADTQYRVTLVDTDNVTVDANGVVSFEEDAATGLALAGTVAADLTVVNGVSVTGAQSVGGIAPTAEGGVSFTVTTDAAAIESFVPVVYVDGGANTRLEIDDNGAPSEAFGVGGAVQTLPDEADAGATGGAISDVDKEAGYVIAAGDLYNLDANDRYYIGADASAGTAVTQATFLAELSEGDSLGTGTSYQPNADLPSDFVLVDDTPGQPTVNATGGAGQVTLDITPVTPALADLDSDDTVVVSRATVTAGADTTLGTADDVVGTYASVATLNADDDEDALTDAVLDYTDAVEAGTYSYTVVVTVDGEASATSTAATATATGDTTAATLSTVTVNDIDNGVGSTSELIVTFNEAVASVDAAAFTVSPSTQAGLEIAVSGATKRNESGTVWTLTLAQPLDDAPTNITYNVTADAAAFTDVAGNDSAVITTPVTFSY